MLRSSSRHGLHTICLSSSWKLLQFFFFFSCVGHPIPFDDCLLRYLGNIYFGSCAKNSVSESIALKFCQWKKFKNWKQKIIQHKKTSIAKLSLCMKRSTERAPSRRRRRAKSKWIAIAGLLNDRCEGQVHIQLELKSFSEIFFITSLFYCLFCVECDAEVEWLRGEEKLPPLLLMLVDAGEHMNMKISYHVSPIDNC